VFEAGVIGREGGATEADRDKPDVDKSDFFRWMVSLRKGNIVFD
jgi:hypothetical protein